MCNLYSITTNQAAIIALFRVVNRYAATSRRCRACFQIIRLQSCATLAQSASSAYALGYAATTADRRASRDQYSQYLLATLAHVAEAGEPLFGARQ